MFVTQNTASLQDVSQLSYVNAQVAIHAACTERESLKCMIIKCINLSSQELSLDIKTTFASNQMETLYQDGLYTKRTGL